METTNKFICNQCNDIFDTRCFCGDTLAWEEYNEFYMVKGYAPQPVVDISNAELDQLISEMWPS